ncbi:putative glycosyl hydrolase 36, glycoside hydrolase superfamily [Helianthus annuus]|nr:putative glycosyl hydrolase 36, glycoside hydrolase superfamily [Helianthus annuus]
MAIISCMSHNTDGLYSAKRTAVMRASDDFWPHITASHTVHIASVAYNTVFLGEFMQPDWDMFHSLHPMADYHGAARAVGGCAIYVRSGTLTITLEWWGVFNCQGAGWCKDGKKILTHDEQPSTITGVIRAKDVNYLPKVADSTWDGDAVAYQSRRRWTGFTLPKNASIPVTLKPREYEVFTVVPISKLSCGVGFAPIGLTEMFNSGGAISEFRMRQRKKEMWS